MVSDPISAYFKYVTKLKYDEKPDYEKCRKEFVNGLKSLGKSNSGDLEFKSTSPQKKASLAAAASSAKEPKRAGTKAAGKPDENTENISPKVKKVRKRNTSPEPAETSESPSKRARSESRSKSSGSQKATQSSGRSVTTVVNNQVNDKNASKTYNFNFELDISFDANVVVNVKRKPKKSSKDEKKKPVESELDASSQSISEIPASEKSFIVETRKIVKKGSRTSPRAKWGSTNHRRMVLQFTHIFFFVLIKWLRTNVESIWFPKASIFVWLKIKTTNFDNRKEFIILSAMLQECFERNVAKANYIHTRQRIVNSKYSEAEYWQLHKTPTMHAIVYVHT